MSHDLFARFMQNRLRCRDLLLDPRFHLLLILLAAPAFAQRPNPGPSPRPNPALEAAIHQIVPITTGIREDDHPAIASGAGRVWRKNSNRILSSR